LSVKRCIITYGHERIPIETVTGTRLLDAILSVQPEHYHICGGRGFCTSCRVRVLSGEGLSAPNQYEYERLGERCGELRLACQCYITGDAIVEPAVRMALID
jgi:adenylate cyclase